MLLAGLRPRHSTRVNLAERTVPADTVQTVQQTLAQEV